jgi:DNA repair protein RadA/Sms
LAVASALVSALTDTPVPNETVVFGEIGLSGEVRAVGQTEARLKEAAKLGFGRAYCPPRGKRGSSVAGIDVRELRLLGDLVEALGNPAPRRMARPG